MAKKATAPKADPMAFFGNLKTVETKKSAAKSRVEHPIAGIWALASLKLVAADIKSKIEGLEIDAKKQMFDLFIKLGKASKTRPSNFHAVEKDAEASCQLKQRSASSPLASEEKAIFEKHGIPFDTDTSKATTFRINPAYGDPSSDKYDPDMMSALGAFMMSKGNIFPADFMERVEGSEHHLVTEASIDGIFAKADKLAAEDFVALVKIATVQSIGPKLTAKADQEAAYDTAYDILDAEETVAAKGEPVEA